MDTVATNKERSLHAYVRLTQKKCVIVHVSNHVATQPTHQPTSSISSSQFPRPKLHSEAREPDGYSII